MAEAQGPSLDWLATGTGDRFRKRQRPRSEERSVPVFDLVGPDPEGWFQLVETALCVVPPALSLGGEGIAVRAPGGALQDEGIVSGKVCYCDYRSLPMQGDVALVQRSDGRAALGFLVAQDMDLLSLSIPMSGTMHTWLSREQVKRVAPVCQVYLKT